MGGLILRRELLPQLIHQLTHEIWHRCIALGCRCARHYFLTVVESVIAMVTAYYGKNWGKILHRELLPQFFTNSHEYLAADVCTLGVDVQDTFFDSGRSVLPW